MRAQLPAGVPTGQFGPRLQAIVSVCSGDYRLSKREIELLVEDFFGVPIALGSIANYGPEESAIGRSLELLTETTFHAWHRVRDGTLSRGAFRKLVESQRAHVVARLQEGTSCSAHLVAGRCREILTLKPALRTFARVDGVEPTNNFGERILHQGVLWRKCRFGTDSPDGSRFVERILTVVPSEPTGP